MAGLLALGAAACGDDVEIVQPTPEPPPPPPPVTATMAPASASVAVGNSVVFAVNASGGVAGDAASWTCASSNTGIATVSVTSTGCQATGVAAGGVTITASVTKSGETVNVGAQLTVTSEEVDEGDPAFILVSGVRDARGDASTSPYSGNVSVSINVERGDQELEELSLLVDGEVVDAQSFGSTMDMGMGMTPEPGDTDAAAEQAVHAFTLSFNSAAYDDHGHPDYTNGEHTISAELEIGIDMADGTHGHQTISSNVITVGFDNEDGIIATVTGLGDGAMNSTTGQVWYGGPDASVEIAALPVLYSGGSAASLTLTDFCDASASTDAEAPFTFAPKCKGTSATEGDSPGETPSFNIAGTGVGILNDDDFPLYLDFDPPPAPTFYPNPNKRENGWVNLTVDFLGEQKSGNSDGWLTFPEDESGGVGGYNPQLRYAEVPSSGGGLDEALAAPILTLASLPAESDEEDAYCAVASAVDLLGNESKLPKAEKDGGTCMMAGTRFVAADATAGTDSVPATGYEALIRNAGAEDATADATNALANAGILVGVDVTSPTVEFTGASLGADSTALSDAADWVVHVSDRNGVIHSDPLKVEISRRDSKKTTKLSLGTVNTETDSFTVANTAPSPRHAVDVGTAGVGYHTITASAKDKAGNTSSSISRVALNDPSSAPVSRLFIVPGDDIFTYAKTLVMTDNLSVKSYSVTLPLGTGVGDLTLNTMQVDAYNAASLTTSRTVQETVKLPYVAIQAGDGTSADAIASLTASVSDQAGTASTGDDGTDELSTPAATDIPAVTGFRTGGAFIVAHGTVSGRGTREAKDPVKLTATAQMEDTNLASPFSRVDFYGRTTAGTSLKFLGSVDTSAADTKLVAAPGRDWIYELVVSAEDYEEIVSDDTSTVVALGVSTKKSGSVAVSATADALDIDLDGS